MSDTTEMQADAEADGEAIVFREHKREPGERDGEIWIVARHSRRARDGEADDVHLHLDLTLLFEFDRGERTFVLDDVEVFTTPDAAGEEEVLFYQAFGDGDYEDGGFARARQQFATGTDVFGDYVEITYLPDLGRNAWVLSLEDESSRETTLLQLCGKSVTTLQILH